MRSDGRKPAELRPVTITPDFIRHAEGSVLIEVGDTRVICTATVEEQVPPFLRDTQSRLGDRRVRHAARLEHDRASHASRHADGSAAAPTRSNGSSAAACGR